MENVEEQVSNGPLSRKSEVAKEESTSKTVASENTVVPEAKKPENKQVTTTENTEPTSTDPIAEPKVGNIGIIIKVNARKGFFYVAYIEKNSTAAQQGLKVGQLIKSIDGRVLVNETTEELNEWLTGPMGTTLSLTFTTGTTVSLLRGAYNMPAIDKVPKTLWDDDLTSSEY
jgi:C-terminal processing protease CtpA/Prc